MTEDAISVSEVSAIDTFGISDQSTEIFIWVFVTGLCQVVDVFGIVTNIINMACFVKQGFKEPVNISLLGLTISDLGCLVTQGCLNAFYTLIVGTNTLHFDPLDVVYLVGGTPHLAFSRVNSWITAIITVERCLCITVPLKIKSIVTTKRMWILISCVYIILLLTGAPIYVVNSYGMKFFPAKNKTLLGLVGTSDKVAVEIITFTITSFFLPFVAFIIIIICTIILVANLQKRTQWRKAATQTDMSTREQKVAMMVVMISAMFIVSFVPVSAIMFSMVFEPQLQIGGKYVNISTVLGTIGLLLESVNSSANIFIYYNMSKKYKDTFASLFCRNLHRCDYKD